MTRYVVDASVAIKWYLPEDYSEHSERLISSSVELFCPDLLISEVGNILWKYVTRAECPHNKALRILKELQSPFLHIWNTALFAESSLDIACRTKRTFYDSVYIALAIKTDCRLVTADSKLYNALKDTPLKKNVLWVEDVPYT